MRAAVAALAVLLGESAGKNRGLDGAGEGDVGMRMKIVPPVCRSMIDVRAP